MKTTIVGIMLATGFVILPVFTARNDLLNLGVQIFLAITLAQSWNLIGGYAGQINLGHAAFFGLGALVTRSLWVGGLPLLAALACGALTASAFGCLIGLPAFRLRGAYFAIGTLGFAEILRITIGNLFTRDFDDSGCRTCLLQHVAALLPDVGAGDLVGRDRRIVGSCTAGFGHSRRPRR